MGAEDPAEATVICGLCQKLRRTPTGGWVHRDETWAVAVQEGYEVPGWVVLQTCRHVESAAGLDEREVASLGPLLKRLTRAIEAVVSDTERVYIVGFGEAFPHWHLLLLPRTAGLDRRGGAVIDARTALIDVSMASECAWRLAEELQPP